MMVNRWSFSMFLLNIQTNSRPKNVFCEDTCRKAMKISYFKLFPRQSSSYQNHHLGLWSSHHEWDSQHKGVFLIPRFHSCYGMKPVHGCLHLYNSHGSQNVFPTCSQCKFHGSLDVHYKSHKSHVFPSTHIPAFHITLELQRFPSSHPHAPRCWWHFEIGIPRAAIRFHHSTLHLNEANLKRMHNAAVATIDMNK